MKKWFDRSFEFDTPVWLFPNLIERLRGTPARLEETLRLLPQGNLTRHQDNKWSIQEHAGHLADLEPLWFGRIDDVLEGRSHMREADLTNRRTFENRHNDRPVRQILSEFRHYRQRLVHRLETFDDDTAERTALHPRLQQPMRVLDLVYFVAEHDDHHLAQIHRLQSEFESNNIPVTETPVDSPARLTASAPVLLVRDVVAAAHYYRDQLGFSYNRFWGDPPDFCILHRDDIYLMLSQAPAGAPLTPHWKVVGQMWNAYFWVNDVESLFADFKRRGARIDYGLGIKPYGIKEFGVQDLDGHDLAFGEPIR